MFRTSVWGYCHTTDNAADLLTREITPTQLQSALLWFQGPTWLTSEHEWPKWSPASILHVTMGQEAQPTSPTIERTMTCNPGVNQCIDINGYSKLTKLYGVTAYVATLY